MDRWIGLWPKRATERSDGSAVSSGNETLKGMKGMNGGGGGKPVYSTHGTGREGLVWARD